VAIDIETTRLWSIREAGRVLKPVISDKSIAAWIRAGILVPHTHVTSASGPGTGSKLDLSDLVFAACLHNLFASGLTHGQLMIRGVRFEKALLELDGVRNAKWGTRQVQKYLTKHAYKVLCHVEVLRPLLAPGKPRPHLVVGEGLPASQETVSNVHFFPYEKRQEHLDRVSAVLPYERHIFFNVQYWVGYVKSQLSQV